MRLYAGKIDGIASEVVQRLTIEGDIDVGDRGESELDVVSVLKEYIRLDRELTERAKDILEIRGLGYNAFGRTKRTLAEQKDFGLGEDAVVWIVNQLLEVFMQSQHIEEIYSDDPTLRRKIKEILHRHMAVDDDLDQEVRLRIKNLQEGTNDWDVEYRKVMDQIKKKHGIGE